MAASTAGIRRNAQLQAPWCSSRRRQQQTKKMLFELHGGRGGRAATAVEAVGTTMSIHQHADRRPGWKHLRTLLAYAVVANPRGDAYRLSGAATCRATLALSRESSYHAMPWRLFRMAIATLTVAIALLAVLGRRHMSCWVS